MFLGDYPHQDGYDADYIRQGDRTLSPWQAAAIAKAVDKHVDIIGAWYFSPRARFARRVFRHLPLRLQRMWARHTDRRIQALASARKRQRPLFIWEAYFKSVSGR